MDAHAQRAALAELTAERGESYAALSRLIGRNAAYLQQFVMRGSPRTLSERDRALLARYFGVPEARLGGPAVPGLVEVPRLDIGASAGPGGLVEDEPRRRPAELTPALFRALRVRPAAASMIRVEGESMAPTLEDGDEILVDRDQNRLGAKGAIFVVRVDGTLMVKRLRSAVGGVELVSDNPDYPPVLRRAGDVEIIGRVVWLSRALL
jgi:repressor LexA